MGFLDFILGPRIAEPEAAAPRAEAANVQAAPTTDAGYSVEANAWSWDLTEEEKTRELQWPSNIEVYDSMRRQDAQIVSVLRALTLPIRRTTWRIDPNGADDQVVEFVAQNLGLPIVGKGAVAVKRTKGRFSWEEHLQHALLMLPHGHSVFEQRFRIERDSFGILRAYLSRLGWRPPRTISKWDVAADGGLIAIEQGLAGGEKHRQEVSRLVCYVNDREGGNWLGQSVLRPAYKPWVLKDRMLRVQAQSIDRNGMGIPVHTAAGADPTTYPEPEDQRTAEAKEVADGLRIAKNLRSGNESGVSLRKGADIKLLGVEGQLPDADKVIRYYDEQIARAMLANFLNLGGDSSKGSYALGATFENFFVMSLQAIAMYIANTANAHIVEDLVDHNFDTEATAPKIVFDEIGSQQGVTAEGIKALIECGALTPTVDLEQFLRQVFRLPPLPDGVEFGDAVREAKSVAEVLQKLYLAVGVVVTIDEARAMLRKAGIELPDGVPDELVAPAPAPVVQAPTEGT